MVVHGSDAAAEPRQAVASLVVVQEGRIAWQPVDHFVPDAEVGAERIDEHKYRRFASRAAMTIMHRYPADIDERHARFLHASLFARAFGSVK